MVPIHYLNVYQKPKQGNVYLDRKVAYQYRHQITAMGWFDTASCQVAASRTEAEDALENWVGNRVAVFVDNPVAAIWEGLISRVSISVGGLVFTRSLDDMLNKVRTTRTYSATSTIIPTVSSGSSLAASQAVYGIKEGNLDMNPHPGASGSSGQADTLEALALALQAWPQTSVTLRGGGNLNIVSLEMVGFQYTLEWETYQQAGSLSRAPNTIITTDILPALANGATFFDNTDFSEIDSNAAYTTQRISRTGSTAWQFIQSLTEPGDGVDRWVAGITPTDNRGNRRLYYRLSNTDIEYTARADQGLRSFNQWGKYVPPWRVRPDAGIRINDVLTAWNGQGDDPRETYIESVQYDAESQAVYWQGIDDITVEGAFQLKRYFKTHGTRFGANVRTVG